MTEELGTQRSAVNYAIEGAESTDLQVDCVLIHYTHDFFLHYKLVVRSCRRPAVDYDQFWNDNQN